MRIISDAGITELVLELFVLYNSFPQLKAERLCVLLIVIVSLVESRAERLCVLLIVVIVSLVRILSNYCVCLWALNKINAYLGL